MDEVNDAPVPRRLLLAVVGSAAAALTGCGTKATPTTAPRPAGAAAPSSPATSSGGEAALRRKIASLLVVGFRGERLDDNDWIVKAVRAGLGGVILFDRDLQTKAVRNISSAAQVTALVQSLRAASPGRLIVSIDQEGGPTSRLNPDNGFPALQSQAQIGATNSPATTRAWAESLVRDLTSVGVNLNYAPVVDLDRNPSNPAIGQLGRSFSANPDIVVGNATEEINVHRAARVKTAIKHFPGLGSATANTDFDVVDVSKTWQAVELEPFQRLIAAGVTDSVLVGHLLNTQLDPNRPASLSPAVVTDLLRGKLGWSGPVVSDDMQAAAITRRHGADEAVALALQAGVDLLVFANQQVYETDVVDRTIDNVVKLVRSGSSPRRGSISRSPGSTPCVPSAEPGHPRWSRRRDGQTLARFRRCVRGGSPQAGQGDPGDVVDEGDPDRRRLVPQPWHGEDRRGPASLVTRGLADHPPLVVVPVLPHVGPEQGSDPAVHVALLQLLHSGEQGYAGPTAQRMGQPGPQSAQREQPLRVQFGGERDDRRRFGQQERAAREWPVGDAPAASRRSRRSRPGWRAGAARSDRSRARRPAYGGSSGSRTRIRVPPSGRTLGSRGSRRRARRPRPPPPAAPGGGRAGCRWSAPRRRAAGRRAPRAAGR